MVCSTSKYTRTQTTSVYCHAPFQQFLLCVKSLKIVQCLIGSIRLRMHQQEACMPLIWFATIPYAASRKRCWHTSCMAAASSSASWKVAASACACFSRSASLPASSGMSLACPSAYHVTTADRRHGAPGAPGLRQPQRLAACVLSAIRWPVPGSRSFTQGRMHRACFSLQLLGRGCRKGTIGEW